LNESWGIQEVKTNKMQQAHCNAMYYLTKSLDDTRIVIDNDGWEHACGDVLTIHDYVASPDILKERYKTVDGALAFTPGGRSLFVSRGVYDNKPVIVSEFGGILFTDKEDDRKWGYSNASSKADFVERYRRIVESLMSSDVVQGFCYTQLTDIESEANGLLTFDRTPKVPPDIIKEINNAL
jgi:hypothetical protein